MFTRIRRGLAAVLLLFVIGFSTACNSGEPEQTVTTATEARNAEKTVGTSLEAHSSEASRGTTERTTGTVRSTSSRTPPTEENLTTLSPTRTGAAPTHPVKTTAASTTVRPSTAAPTAFERYLKLNTLGDTWRSEYTGKDYRLVWMDSFGGTRIMPGNWNVMDSDTMNYSGEKEYKLPQNVVVADGKLTIIAKREKYQTRNYTSGYIESRGKREFQYGRMEMYAKLPYGKGIWAGFWTVGVEQGSLWSAEIDIMEMVGGSDFGLWNYNGDSRAYWTLHWDRYDYVNDRDHLVGYNYDKRIGEYTVPGFESQRPLPKLEKLGDRYHVYGVEWTDKVMVGYFDNQKIGEVDLTDPTMQRAFHLQKHYLILSLFVGGSWSGMPDQTTVFPQRYEVDWIRVWQ